MEARRSSYGKCRFNVLRYGRLAALARTSCWIRARAICNSWRRVVRVLCSRSNCVAFTMDRGCLSDLCLRMARPPARLCPPSCWLHTDAIRARCPSMVCAPEIQFSDRCPVVFGPGAKPAIAPASSCGATTRSPRNLPAASFRRSENQDRLGRARTTNRHTPAGGRHVAVRAAPSPTSHRPPHRTR